MKTIIIISHFLSCNIGDKIQSYSLLNAVHNVILVNLFPFNKDYEYCGQLKRNIYSFDYLSRQVEAIDYVIVFTGSIGSVKIYNDYLRKLLDRVNNQFIMIGGFSSDVIQISNDPNYYVDYSRLDYLFSNKKVLFYARTVNELELFKLMGNRVTNDNIVCTYRHGGDIIVNSANTLQKKENTPTDRVAILSIHLIQHMKSNNTLGWLKELLKETDKILLMDAYADKKVLEYLESIGSTIPVVITDRKDVLLTHLLEANVVISSRLHGAVISAALGIPTYLLPSDNSINSDIYLPNKNRLLGSFKYHSFCKSALTKDIGLGKLIRHEDLAKFHYEPYKVDNETVQRYNLLCKHTEQQIINIVQ